MPGDTASAQEGDAERIGLDELEAGPPVQNPDKDKDRLERQIGSQVSGFIDHEETQGLDEIDAGAPDEESAANDAQRLDKSLEQERSKEEQRGTSESEQDGGESGPKREQRWLAEIFVHSHLIFFSIWGVLARLGLVALTTYPGAPLPATVVWANVGGSLVIGFLREDRMLFRRQWRASVEKTQEASSGDDGSSSESEKAAHKTFIADRSTIHGFIGLTVGFCGTFTSFADIIRDAFLAISNNLDTANISNLSTTSLPLSRNSGYSVLAVIAVLWIEISMSLAALELGAHIAIATRGLAEVMPVAKRRWEPTLNFLVVFLGWGLWIGAIIMAIFPPFSAWRGQALFAVVLAPVGAMLRFHLSKLLNPMMKPFPLGTFTANVFGTLVLGMVYDLQHAEPGAKIISCQILQGVGDGFCGGLTTVSTWVLELKALRLKHAYFYAFTSVAVTLAGLVVVMGSVRWSRGFDGVACEI